MVCMICEWSFSSARIFLLMSGSTAVWACAVASAAHTVSAKRRVIFDIKLGSCGDTWAWGTNNNCSGEERQRRFVAAQFGQTKNRHFRIPVSERASRADNVSV